MSDPERPRADRPPTSSGSRPRGTTASMMSTELAIRSRVPGSIAAQVVAFGDRRAVVTRSDSTDRAGALVPADGQTLAAAVRFALDRSLPFVGYLASSGAAIDEGVPALAAWGEAARELTAASGIIPLVFVVTGPAVSGPALLLGLADVVIMTDEAYAFVSGPTMVREFTGEMVSKTALGGPGVHARSTGAAHLLASDLDSADAMVAELLSLLPTCNDDEPPRSLVDDPPDRPTPEAGDVLPATTSGSYDVRAVLSAVVDHGELLELRGGWAHNLVTALATIDGRPVGIVANQPQSIAGTLDIPASQKGARFVAFCDAFNLPIITFVDTSGFYPGKDLEWRGMIRHGAQLAFAYARATVPRICVTLRKSYGGAYIVMDSKRMGNDLHLAWPTAEIAVMGANQAASILMRRASDDERAQFVVDYEEHHLNPFIAASRGTVDRVIEPSETRAEIAAALAVLSSKRERLVGRRHDNTPL
ncbi:MAG: carboxyl transferase domain-containing protein [Actinomycetota bacterium]|nr:carboxyl transferase domain-containing protein [Actinomycetota bacterium]